MPDHFRRRTFLGGTIGAITGLAGCGSTDDGRENRDTSSDTKTTMGPATSADSRVEEEKSLDSQSEVPIHDHSGEDGGGAVLNADRVTASSIEAEKITAGTIESESLSSHSIASYIVEQRDGKTRCFNPSTGEILASAEVGEEDGRVIQTALDALEEGGGSVFIRKATYEIHQNNARQDHQYSDAGLQLKASHVHILSDSATIRFFDHDDGEKTQDDFVIKEADFVRVEGLHLDGNKDVRSGSTSCLNLIYCDHVTIRDCLIESARRKEESGGGGYGISPFAVNHLTVDNCVIRNNDRHGIHPGNNSREDQTNDPDAMMADYNITNNTFVNNATNPTGAAVDLRDYSKRVLISANYFENNRFAVRVKGNHGNVGQIRITDNLFVNEDENEVPSAQVQLAEPPFDHVDISGNVFELPDAPGQDSELRHIYAKLDPENRNLEQNVLRIQNNQFKGGGKEAVWVFTYPIERLFRTVLIEGNHFQRIHGAFLNCDGIEYLVIRQNTFDRSLDVRDDIRLGSETIGSGVFSGNVQINAKFQSIQDIDVLQLSDNTEL